MTIIFGFGKKKEEEPKEQNEQKSMENIEAKTPATIAEWEEVVKRIFNNSFDIIIKTMDTVKEKVMIVFVDGLVNKDLVDRDLIRPLKSEQFNGNLSLAIKSVYSETSDIDKFVDDVLAGNVAVFYDNSKKITLVDFRGWDQRAVEEPLSESVIRGPKEGFTENIRVNTSLIRRKVKTPNLIIEKQTLGKQTQTTVAIAYIDGIVNQDVLKEVKRRLSKIDVGAILESGYIEQYIDENTFSPFSGIGLTQKPDSVAKRMLEGRVAILCDGTPHVLTIPELFMDNIHTCEDYYNRTIYSSFVRLIRMAALFITVIFPGLTVAVITFNPEMIPAVFLSSIISSTLKTPMPVAAEILVLTILFELIKEAGTRLPKAVGSAITIVGSLIIGEAAVNAGIVSELSVIVVATSALASFMVPNLVEYILVYRALFWLMGSTMGLIGIGSGFIIMMTQLISTKSFGIPILSDFSKNEMKDTFVRFPLKFLRYRPKTVVKDNRKENNMR